MIFDQLTHLSSYLGCHPNLDTAIRFLQETDLTTLPEGRTEIDGDNVFLNVMEACARPEEELQFEVHRYHMDIQIDLSGTERIATGDRRQAALLHYNPQADLSFVRCPKLADCEIGTGNFILCMAGEPHMPGILTDAGPSLKKCVVKIFIPNGGNHENPAF